LYIFWFPVKETRVELKGKIETDQIVADMDQELLNLDYEWTITIGDLNDNRNKKIVSIVQLSQQINEMHAMVGTWQVAKCLVNYIS